MHTGFWCGNPKERDDSGEIGGWDNIKMDLREVECGQHGLDSCDSEYGQVVGPCECSNEHSGSMKCIEFLNQLRNTNFSRSMALHGTSLLVFVFLLIINICHHSY
jgi:hypothetical protein